MVVDEGHEADLLADAHYAVFRENTLNHMVLNFVLELRLLVSCHFGSFILFHA